MTRPARIPTSPAVLRGALVASLLSGSALPLAAQPYELGLALGVADTDQNAASIGGTVAWNGPGLQPWGIPLWLVIRGIADGEVAVPDFKDGLGYESDPKRVYIVDETGEPQRPDGDELWQIEGWDLHGAIYATATWRRLFGGLGLAANGLDDSAGKSLIAGAYVTRRTELQLEFLDWTQGFGGRWRMRLSVGFWCFRCP